MKMADPADDLSPLDRIRQAEAEATRRIAAAREAADQFVAQARSQAELVKRQAREAGQRQGKAKYQATISGAEEEARTIEVEAGKLAEDIRHKGKVRMDMAIGEAINFLLGLEGVTTE
jgi:vacuolar-type H+-ATPase subunit H